MAEEKPPTKIDTTPSYKTAGILNTHGDLSSIETWMGKIQRVTARNMELRELLKQAIVEQRDYHLDALVSIHEINKKLEMLESNDVG